MLMVGANTEVLPATARASNAIRKRLGETAFKDADIYFDTLDLGRFPGKTHQDRKARFLAERYAEKRPDVVIALSRQSLDYLLEYRDAVAPGIPIVFCCMGASAAGAAAAAPDVTGVVSANDWPRTLSLAARLQPAARDVVLISGASEYDRGWAEDAQRDLEAYLHPYNVRHLAGLAYDALLEEVARLPREAIVLLLPVFRDGDGRPRVPRQVAGDVARHSGAPVYAPYDTFFGEGIVGGYMDTFESVGIAAADLVVEILARKGSGMIPPPTNTLSSYRVDARQLERWGLSESSLPAGTEVLYRKPTLWEQHRNVVLGTMAAFALLTTTLIALLIQMIRRRRAEASLKASEERMTFAAASSNTGLWQYDVATRQLWATEHCRSMFGLDSEPLTPLRFLRAVHPDDRRVALAAVRSVLVGQRALSRGEFRVVDRNGQERWLSATGHRHLGNDGKLVTVSGVVMDITKRRIAENEARQLSERLLTVQDEERQQIARELHDSTMQHLTAIGLIMMSLKARVAADAKARRLTDDIEGSLGEASRELRTFTYLLSPPELEMDGLRSTLRRFVDGFARRTGLKTRLSVSRRVDELPMAVQRSLLRVVQEALANVHRHASATEVDITLKEAADRIHLKISDNGKGIKGLSHRETNVAPRAGVGLPGMAARLRKLGGELRIRTGPTGTTLYGVFPAHAYGSDTLNGRGAHSGELGLGAQASAMIHSE